MEADALGRSRVLVVVAFAQSAAVDRIIWVESARDEFAAAEWVVVCDGGLGAAPAAWAAREHTFTE